MGKVIDGGWVPEDDPMFSGSLMMFSVRKPKQSTEPGKQENPEKRRPRRTRAKNPRRNRDAREGEPGEPRGPPETLAGAVKRLQAEQALSPGGRGEPRFRLRDPKEHEALRGKGFDKDRLKRPRGGIWYRSAYDELMRNPETAPVAAALLHHVDRANELRGALTKPIRDTLAGVKRRELPAILDGFSKILEAKDNKQPAPEGLHPKAYELWGAWQKSAAMVEKIAKDKILVYDRKLNDGKGAWRPFQAATDYVPRNVKREVIDVMRTRYDNPRAAKR